MFSLSLAVLSWQEPCKKVDRRWLASTKVFFRAYWLRKEVLELCLQASPEGRFDEQRIYHLVQRAQDLAWWCSRDWWLFTKIIRITEKLN
jgi:hypothetical protein